MINSHVHLDFSTVQPIAENTVAIVPSIGQPNWANVQTYPHFALGVHPWWVEMHAQTDLQQLERLIQRSHPIAIGECGLDYAKAIDRDTQLYFFTAQLKLAEKYNLPVIIHSVKATEDVIFLLKQYPALRGEIHAFSGSIEQANVLVKMGFYLGFGLQMTRSQSVRLTNMVQNLPLQSILIETDDDSNPNDLLRVAQAIAEIRKISLDTVVQQCDNNAISLFNLQ